MVLYIMKWNIRPEKKDEYLAWSQGAIGRTISVPGVVELRAYRPASGTSQVVITFEFADMAAWAAWHSNEVVQEVLDEVHALASDVTLELWGRSPVIPEPIRPGG